MNRRRVTQIVVLCFCLLLLLAPVYESFDRWDGFPRSENDTVLNLIGVVAFCGLVLVAAKSLCSLVFALADAFSGARRFNRVGSCPLLVGPCSAVGESPPSLLLCPLRI